MGQRPMRQLVGTVYKKNMKQYRYIILTLVLAAIANIAWAQPRQKPKEDEDIVVVSNDFIKNEKGILIKWFSTDFAPKEGYNVYRKLTSGNVWEKVTATPVIIQQTIPANLNFDTEEISYWNASKKLKPEEHDKAGMIIGFSYLKAINNFAFAELMGMAYKDNSVASGMEYKYMVKTIKGGKEILVDSSIAIQQGAWMPDLPITKITTERKRKEIDFKFKVEHHKYYSIDIERKALGSTDPFKPKNSAPILIQKDENGNFPDIVFSDKPVHKDTGYVYLVYGVNYFGKRTAASAEIQIQRKDFDPPKPVSDIQYDQDTLEVKLTWVPNAEKDDDLKGYEVYRSLYYDKEFEKVTPSLIPLTSNTYTDKVPQPGDYYYIVASVDKSNNEASSPAIMADIRDVVAPARPIGVKAVAEAGMVKLSWDANTEKDLKGYLVFKSLVGKNVYVAVNGEAIKTNYFEEKLPKQLKNRFVYRLLAVDTSFNRSKYSDSMVVKLPDLYPPATPIIKGISIEGNKGLKIEWLQSVDNDLSGYLLYRVDIKSKDKTPVLINDKIDVSAKNYIDNSALKNSQYTYAMISVDSSGNKSPLSEAYPFHWVDTKSKLQVKNFDVKLVEKEKKAKISWNIEKDEHYKGCIVFRAFNNGEMEQLSGNLNEVTEFVDTKLKEGNYTYLLKLYDKLGNITKSSLVKVILAPEKNN